MSGGLERLCQELWRQLLDRGHAADLVRLPFVTSSKSAVVRSVLGWRLVDLAARLGGYDLVIPTAFPSYFISHPRKVTWLVAQFRQVYELNETDFVSVEWMRDAAWRKAIQDADVAAIGESDGLFAISKNVAHRLRAFNGLEASVLYPPPITMDDPSDGDGEFLLSVGRLDGLKRQHLLVEAMAHVRSAARCVIVGTGEDHDVLAKQIEDSGLASRVELVGWVDDQSLRTLYSRARAVFYGPFDEDLGFVTLEAFAAGKPVITLSDSGGTLEFVEPGQTGWIAPPDSEAIAALIDEVWMHPSVCAEMGKEARDRVAALTWDTVLDSLVGSI
jgi:glycosyltransferase involved in cell wall biosynthesis